LANTLAVPVTINAINAGSATITAALPQNLGGATATATITVAAAPAPGFEADVAPRPNGNNGQVTVADWVQTGRFAAGFDTPALGSEFQRADCAPRDTRGNGSITISDWVQAGRYAAGLDPIVAAGGPTAPTQLQIADCGLRIDCASAAAQQARAIRVASATLPRGQQGALSIEMDAQGNENALGFSLSFDPAQLSFVSAVLGADANGASFNINSFQAANGKLGFALALPAGQTLAAGQRRLFTLTFTAVSSAAGNTAQLTFGDQPVTREVVNPNAEILTTNFAVGTINLARALASVSAASFSASELAPAAIIAAFGTNLATTVQTANSLPLPTTLAGTTVRVRDSAGAERLAPLFFVAPSQVNYLIPDGTATGPATVTINSGANELSAGMVNIAAVAPGLFSANSSGQGVAAAIALRIKADGSQSFEAVSRFENGQFVAVPLDLGPAGEQVFLLLFGTGLRGRSNLNAASLRIGGTSAAIFYLGAQGDLAGLDQVNVQLPRSLAGRGEVDLLLTVDGKAANTVRVAVR
jgi:uncharacterized protein (TIGR03437 family)